MLGLIRRLAGGRGQFTAFGLQMRKAAMLLAVGLIAVAPALGQGDDRLVGVWDSNEGFRTVALLFRSDGRYQLDTQSTDPNIDLSSTERGRYQVEGQALTLTPYDYLAKPAPRTYQFGLSADALSLTNSAFGQTESFEFRPDSKADVLAREAVHPGLLGIWRRHIAFLGEVECTYRPGGYYVAKTTYDDPQFATSYIRGRFELAGTQLTLRPYSNPNEVDELDFFGDELTLINTDGFSGASATFQAVPGSDAEVQVKAAAAEAFLGGTNWQVGVWEVREPNRSVDLTLRPDGRYAAESGTGMSKATIRGRYDLGTNRLHLIPFIGQDLYASSGGEAGSREQVRQLDYYDGELQIIDLEAVTQSVTVARQRPGSRADVTDKVNQAHAAQASSGWCVGIWQVNDPAGWMEFTFRPDLGYIAKSGSAGVPHEVERGRYRLGVDKLTLSPYPNLGAPRGFETDLYDGTWLLIGDPMRMLVAQKVPGSEVVVTQATTDPDSLKGEGGPLIGLWTVELKGYSAQLLFRPDGQFRLARCAKGKVSEEYGLYSVDVASRTLVLDSRLAESVTAGLDLYGASMTLVNTNQGFPVTYVTDPAGTDAALQASFAADAAEAKLDALWLTRVTLGPRNPARGEPPPLEIDPAPGHILEGATVFTDYHNYERIIPSFVNFEDYQSVPVNNAQDWFFLPNGRVMIRFTQYVSGGSFPFVIPQVVKVWGAYRIDPSQASQDILHLHADNTLRIETDAGEQVEMTLENGRRYLFWGKNRALLDEWAAEVQPVACQAPVNFDPNFMNTGLSLQTSVPPDTTPEALRFSLRRAGAGQLTIQGADAGASTLVTEYATSLTAPVLWKALQTNGVPVGAFNFTVTGSTNVQTFYRLRRQ